MKEIHGWGRYPIKNADIIFPLASKQITGEIGNGSHFIARGLGRSYGDSSLSERVIDTRYLDHFLAFDEVSGLLTCASGVSLDEVLRVFVPRGWFLPVTPGTRFVSVGGAIAGDVHGKNHHVAGSFCDHVIGLELLLGSGERVLTSTTEKPDLFHATCGGMGLTGVILSASIRLKPIHSSDIVETTIKAPNLDAALAVFEQNPAVNYSVAWIDCLTRGKNLGRSLIMLGEHAKEGPLTIQKNRPLSVPFEMSPKLLNYATVKAFNALYYAKTLKEKRIRCISFEPFFYPLDRLSNWNRLYGKQGCVQYQFVLPGESGAKGLRKILEHIAASGKASFLAVLKLFGEGNKNYLSFPYKGYTLALDFRAEPSAFRLMDELDKFVLDYGGRLYVGKDARMSEKMFKAGYPRWQEFENVRSHYHAIGKFSSFQSRRLGLQ